MSAYPPGVYKLPEKEYRDADAIANSDIKHAKRSLAHYYAARVDPEREPEKDTPVKIAGSALHTCILEPWEFGRRFVFVPDDAPKDLRHLRDAKNKGDGTVASIAFWDAFEEQIGNRKIIDRQSTIQVQKAAAHIRSHPELQAYLSEGSAEDSIFAVDPVTGLPVKIRTDWRRKVAGMNVILDFKSTDDARPPAFQRTAYNFDYFQGAAYYSDVHEWAGLGHVDLYLLVAFERDAPHGVKIYEVTDEELDRGRRQYRRGLALIKHARETGEYPSYSTDIERLAFPAWAKEEE